MKLLRNNITVGILIASQLMYGVPAYAEKYTSEPSPQIHGRAPVASGLAFDNQMPALGDTVKLFYVFSDLDGDAEHGTAVQWLRDGQPIQGATAFSYTLSEARGDRPGQRLSAEVTPKTDPTLSEPSIGQVASLEIMVAGDPAAPPVVTVTEITGKLTVGSTLTGVYEYKDGGSGSSDASTKLWLNGGHTDTDNDDTYVLADDDAGLVLTFQVQAKNLLGVVGNTDSMDTATAAGVTDGNGAGGVVNLNVKPVISDLKINGTLKVGEKLVGEYSYDANGSGSGDASTYKWALLNQSAAGVGDGNTVTNSGEVPAYTIKDIDAGKVLEVSVQAKNQANVVGNQLTMTTSNPGSTIDGGSPGGLVVNLNVKPVISDLKINGTLKVGEKLVGEYSYDANGSGSGDASTYKWALLNQSAAGVGDGNTVTNSGEVPAYTIKDIDAGKVLEVSVQAKNQANVVGNQLTMTTSNPGSTIDGGSPGGLVVNLNVKPVISDLKINGTLKVGEKLVGEYSYDANGSGSGDASTYKWALLNQSAAGVGDGNTVTNSGEVPAYTIKDIDAGKVLEVSVQAKNQANVVGNQLTMTTSNPGSTIDGGTDDGKVINPEAKPSIKDLKVSGKLNPGEKLKATYTFETNHGNQEDMSFYLWGWKDDTGIKVANEGSAVKEGGNVPEHLIGNDDVGKTLEVSVQPKNGAGKIGEVKTSDPTTAVLGVVPVARNVKITPSLTNKFLSSAGQILRGSYDYEHSIAQGNSTFQWYRSDQPITGNGANTKEYRSSKADIGTIVSFGVTPVSIALTNNIGAEVKSEQYRLVNPITLFYKPDTAPKNLNDADSYCRYVKGTRLGTRDELVALFYGATSGQIPVFDIFNQPHGWPGGSGGEIYPYFYWSSDRPSGGRVIQFPTFVDTFIGVNLSSGNDRSSFELSKLLQVACVR
ncbi:hypothetical protein KHO49_17460 [Pseudomonas sp. RC4D1]|uniref:hypothetical protein n=1 Tax=Pseudomonas sp. RC4D1 TaxID=2834407 RepID=UPI001BCAF3DF|nr:hypothetical protein [Pseudomonas sp. RC4D1]MBS7560130.1 hypothetical protein [Pseudomonas sp. RC4D1]